MATFWLICGMSGSGKTTYAHSVLDHPNNKIRLFDVDEYYKKINGDECDRSNTYQVWMTIYNEIHQCELDGIDVALVTNALTVANREEFVEWFPTFQHNMIWFMVEYDICLMNNKLRNRVIPEDVMKKQWETMEIPNPSEKGWDKIIFLVDIYGRGPNTELFMKGR